MQNVLLNRFFGDLWIENGESLIRINDGQIAHVGNRSGFAKIGEIDSIETLDLSFYDELRPCPICNTNMITCVQDSMNLKWKIGCTTHNCPCCVEHMVGWCTTRGEAVRHWNK